MRAFVLIAALAALATPAGADTRQLTGNAGVLGEWELTATVTETAASSRAREFTGALTITHVGICTQDGPEQRTGQIRFQLIGSSASRMKAKLVMDGVECAYDGRLDSSYAGIMSCPDRRPVPLMIWLK
jgi:hypothetical protein